MVIPHGTIEQDELSESPIDIKEYFYLFKAWAWLIVLAGLLAGAAAYVVSTRITPVYEASTTLLISAPSTIGGVDPSSLVTSQTMTSTYAKMLLDRPVLQGVIDQLALQTTPEDFKKSISVDAVINTQLLTVTVENTDPALAAAIANGLATGFSERIQQLQSQRFAASREGLAKQVSDMEALITDTNNQIADITSATDPSKLQQLEAQLTQYLSIYSNLVTNYEQVRLAEDPASTIVIGSDSANVPSIREGLAKQISDMEALITDTNNQIADITSSTDPSKLQQLEARLTQYRSLYSNLVTSYEQVRLAEAQTSTNVVVSEPANVPIHPGCVQGQPQYAAFSRGGHADGGRCGLAWIHSTIPSRIRMRSAAHTTSRFWA